MAHSSLPFDPANVVGLEEISERLCVSVNEARKLTTREAFPPPLRRLDSGVLYWWPEVAHWARKARQPV